MPAGSVGKMAGSNLCRGHSAVLVRVVRERWIEVTKHTLGVGASLHFGTSLIKV